MNNSIITRKGVGACDSLGVVSFIWSTPSQLERTGMNEWVWHGETMFAKDLENVGGPGEPEQEIHFSACGIELNIIQNIRPFTQEKQKQKTI